MIFWVNDFFLNFIFFLCWLGDFDKEGPFLVVFAKFKQRNVTFVSQINFLKAHCIYCRNRLAANYLFKSYFYLDFNHLIIVFTANSFVTGLWDILLKFRFGSCFRKHFQRVPLAYCGLCSSGINLEPVSVDHINRRML